MLYLDCNNVNFAARESLLCNIICYNVSGYNGIVSPREQSQLSSLYSPRWSSVVELI